MPVEIKLKKRLLESMFEVGFIYLLLVFLSLIGMKIEIDFQ